MSGNAFQPTTHGARASGCSPDRRCTAHPLVLFQVFQQGFGGPLVSGGAPVVVVCPPRVAQFRALAVDEVSLVNDGNPPLCGHFVHSGKCAAPKAAHSV